MKTLHFRVEVRDSDGSLYKDMEGMASFYKKQ